MSAVFIDTNVLKFSATQLPRLRPRQTSIQWGGRSHELTVHDLVTINPNDYIRNPKLKGEVDLLPTIADLAKRGVLECLVNIETLMESWGLPDMDSDTGPFYGAHLKEVDAPVQYGRIHFQTGRDPKEDQYHFLCSLSHPRFLEWQKATGAYQGDMPRNQRQLLDAFHLWCAEHNRCEFFLTLDFKLIKVLHASRHQSSVRAIEPSQLLDQLTSQNET